MISFIRNLIWQDFWLKLFSLALAILIYLTVTFALNNEVSLSSLAGSADQPRTFANIPVLVRAAAADVREFKVSPMVVTVTVSGQSRALQKLKIDQIEAVVDLTGIESARGLRKRLVVTVPQDIKIMETVPDEVEVIVPPKK